MELYKCDTMKLQKGEHGEFTALLPCFCTKALFCFSHVFGLFKILPYSSRGNSRRSGRVEKRYLAWLITTRLQVQVLSLQPAESLRGSILSEPPGEPGRRGTFFYDRHEAPPLRGVLCYEENEGNEGNEENRILKEVAYRMYDRFRDVYRCKLHSGISRQEPGCGIVRSNYRNAVGNIRYLVRRVRSAKLGQSIYRF